MGSGGRQVVPGCDVAFTRSEGQVALKWELRVWMRRGVIQMRKTGECTRKHLRAAVVNVLVPEQSRRYFEYLKNSQTSKCSVSFSLIISIFALSVGSLKPNL